ASISKKELALLFLVNDLRSLSWERDVLENVRSIRQDFNLVSFCAAFHQFLTDFLRDCEGTIRFVRHQSLNAACEFESFRFMPRFVTSRCGNFPKPTYFVDERDSKTTSCDQC